MLKKSLIGINTTIDINLPKCIKKADYKVLKINTDKTLTLQLIKKNLNSDSIVKLDEIYRIKLEDISFKIGSVTE